MEKLFTIAQAAEILNISVSAIRKWHAAGRIKSVKIGPKVFDKFERDRRAIRIPESELKNLMTS